MAIELTIDDDLSEALRIRAEFEARTAEEVARDAVLEYLERRDRFDRLKDILDTELPDYSDALRRLAE